MKSFFIRRANVLTEESFVKSLFLSVSFLFSVFAVAGEVEMLTAAQQHPLVAAYLKQDNEGIDLSMIRAIKAPGTAALCTFMASGNRCSMSFRVLNSNGETLMSGAIHYNGLTEKYSIFRILEAAPDPGSDFEAFSRVPGSPIQ